MELKSTMHRYANIDDLDFIYGLIIDSAKDGHFDRRLYTMPEAARGWRVELASIISERKRINGLFASAIVYDVDEVPVGFVLMSAGEGNKGNELWMAAIHPEHRGRGHGTRMIRGVLDQFKGRNLILLARCAPASETMYRILLKSGFQHAATGEEGYRGLTYQL